VYLPIVVATTDEPRDSRRTIAERRDRAPRIPPTSKRKGEHYKLIWKERVGFARLAIEHGIPIVPVADPAVCRRLRDEVAVAIEMQIADLLAVQSADPERYPVQRLLRRIAARLGV
jgi:hypothetical protein